MDTIRIFTDDAGEFRWQRKAPNGQIISQGESHPHKYNAQRAARRANPDNDWTFDYDACTD